MGADGDLDQRALGLVAVKGDLGELFGASKARAFGQDTVALADLGGVWSLDEVTGVLTDLADRATDLATREDVDVVVELIGGDEGIAKDTIELALDNGKDVVTANKALLAIHGQALAERAEAAGRVIRTPEDQGVLYLIDDRFARPEVRRLLPTWWQVDLLRLPLKAPIPEPQPDL